MLRSYNELRLYAQMNTIIALIFLLISISHAENEDCSTVDCGFAISICTPDSVLVKYEAESGKCCPPDATCECDESHCAKLAIECDSGMDRIRVRKGTHKAGQCCDLFECRLPVQHCDPDACPKPNEVSDLHTLADESCPMDSFRPTSYVPLGECCLIVPDCRCKASICEPVRCSINEIVVVDKKGDGVPGRCCDKFHCEPEEKKTECVVNGVYYADGEQWNSADACETCSCTNGVKLCRKMECQPIEEHCNWVGIADGSCCPVCLGCKDDDDVERNIGDNWAKDDCTNCTCDDSFKSSCQKTLCKVECEAPRKVEGQCCPVCDSPLIIETPVVCGSVELCPMRCEHGLLRNQWGCFECKCAEDPQKFDNDEFHPIMEPSPVDCPELNAKTCKKQCAHGYLRDMNNCDSCKCAKCPPTDQCYKQCLYGFETNSLGCPVCKCRVKSKIDARLSLDENAAQDLHDICVSRDKQTGALIERDSGEWWSDNKCRQCFCQQHTEFCSLITCPRRPTDCPADNWTTRPNDCCPSCNIESKSQRHQLPSEHILTVCHSPGNGRLFVDVETWKLDECISCTCRVGHVLCSAKRCPAIACEDPIEHSTDQCCKLCPELNTSSVIHVNIGYCIDKLGTSHPIHSTWREDDCHSCTCAEDGTVRCFEQKCQPLDSSCNGRALMVKGQCCPVCSDSLGTSNFCTYKENIYGLNEEFHDGQCRNCTCKLHGIVECVERQCPYCEEPIYTPNSCCPQCQDKTKYLLEGNGHTVFMDNVYFTQPMTIYLLLIGLALLILCTCVVCSVLLGKCFYKRKKSLTKGKLNTRIVSNKRNVSECESANTSLLSSDTHNVSLSPATSLIVHADKSAVHSSDRLPPIPSRFV